MSMHLTAGFTLKIGECIGQDISVIPHQLVSSEGVVTRCQKYRAIPIKAGTFTLTLDTMLTLGLHKSDINAGCYADVAIKNARFFKWYLLGLFMPLFDRIVESRQESVGWVWPAKDLETGIKLGSPWMQMHCVIIGADRMHALSCRSMQFIMRDHGAHCRCFSRIF